MKTIFNFKNKQQFKELERKAYDGTIDVSSFPPAEYMYFSELRKIYYAFKFEGLPKAEAAKQKELLLCRYRSALKEHENYCEVYRAYQANIRKAGMLISQINKSDNIQEIAVLACEALGLMMDENTFAVRMKKRMEELQCTKN